MRITRSRIYTAFFAGLMAIIAGVITWVYFFYATPGKIRHDAFMGSGTAARLMLQPYLVQRYISSLAPAGTRFIKGVPQLSSMQGGPIRINWIHRLPYEITLLVKEQAEEDALGAAFFVNVRPEPNDFMEALNESSFFHDVRFAEWRPNRVVQKQPGVLMTQGDILVPQDTQAVVAAQWPEARAIPPPPLSGKHLLEFSADNENGVLMQWYGAVIAAYPRLVDDALHQLMVPSLLLVRELNVTGDLVKADEVRFYVEVVCDGGNQPALVEDALNGVADWLGARVMAIHHFSFSGHVGWRNAFTLTGDFALTGFEGVLQRALGE